MFINSPIDTMMKKIVITLILSVVSLLAVPSCQKVKQPATKDTVTVATQPSGMQSAFEGVKKITIWPTASWTATVDVDWIKVVPSSGERGTQEVQLQYEENFTGAVRTGIVTFSAAEGSDTYTLTQNL